MKKSDFDEVTRLMLIRADIAKTLEKLRRAEDQICSVDAVVFGRLSDRLASEPLTIDVEKLSIGISDRGSPLLGAVSNALCT